MTQIGLIGCGVIGRKLANDIETILLAKASLHVVCDKHYDRAEALVNSLKAPAQICTDYAILIPKVDFVIEAAGATVACDIARQALEQAKDVMIVSVGGLLDDPELCQLAEQSEGRLYIPSGAIAGLDALSAVKMAEIHSVTITTRKPPQGLKGAPYLESKGIDMDSVTQEMCVFEGTAREAVKAFPKNINVAATLSLAGLGPDQTRVRILTSPEWTKNSHEVEVISTAGRMVALTENNLDPSNPKTSYLAALSASVLLQKHFSHVKIGA